MKLFCFLALLGIYSAVFAESKMVLVKGGSFVMGRPTTERQRNADEKQHTVTVNDFYCDAYEVQQKDYERITGKNPSTYKGESLPVQNVSYFDALEYCNLKSKAEGLQEVYTLQGKDVFFNRNANGYRLLTEAEWEYACRAGTTTIFNTGNWNHVEEANYQGSYPYLIEENYMHHTEKNVVTGKVRNKPIAVNSLKPNAFGLYNMHGNVSEWVFDFYGEYDVSDSANPAGAKTGIYRVNRGGAFNDFGKHLRSAYRSATNPQDSDENLGFRIARSAIFDSENIQTRYDSEIAKIQIPKNPKILIAYFSYSGNTESAAEHLNKILRKKHGNANVDLVEIEMQKPYRGGIYEASQKDLNASARPPLKTKIADMKKYDVILLGYPTWWATLPMPVMTFLESYDFRGKTVISFSSHGGTRYGDSVSDLNKALPQSYVGLPFEFFYGGGSDLESRLESWVKKKRAVKWASKRKSKFS
ncbi:flavodoxin [Fibrobacter intestinalis]|uniref:flavodoxin n=1 Tax=Fibrobacter intestinalis TaxID=28122 RepID=UPI0023F3A3B9|nr:flavodoxin [Fibrobacter intestinalis]MDD7299126.1 flavodoxin [Fibrobacter intestinalis]